MSMNRDFEITDFSQTPSLSIPATSRTHLVITADANVRIMCWSKPEIQISITEGKEYFQAMYHKRTRNLDVTDYRESHSPAEIIIRAPRSLYFLEAELRNNSTLQSDIVPYVGFARLKDNAFASLSCHNLALLTDNNTCHAMCDVVTQKSERTNIKGIGSAIVHARGGICEINGWLSTFVTSAGETASVTHEGKLFQSMNIYRSADSSQNGFVLPAAGTRKIFEQLMPASPLDQQALRRNTLRAYFTRLFLAT